MKWKELRAQEAWAYIPGQKRFYFRNVSEKLKKKKNEFKVSIRYNSRCKKFRVHIMSNQASTLINAVSQKLEKYR